jgi:hypothetical protein
LNSVRNTLVLDEGSGMGRTSIIECRCTLDENREGTTDTFDASDEPRKKRFGRAMSCIFARTREEI